MLTQNAISVEKIFLITFCYLKGYLHSNYQNVCMRFGGKYVVAMLRESNAILFFRILILKLVIMSSKLFTNSFGN